MAVTANSTIFFDFHTGRFAGATVVERIGLELMRIAAFILARWDFLGFSYAARLVRAIFPSRRAVRVRFADLRAVTRSVTLPQPIAATTTLAEVAEELVRNALADHPHEAVISLLGISVSNLEIGAMIQLELPLGLADEVRRPGAVRGASRWLADRAVDAIRERFGREAVGYGSVALGASRAVPDAFRELAEKEL